MPQHSEAQARLVVDDEFRVGPVHDRVFGSFVEHLGRCVYTGIYEPGHPTADAEGFRQDVIDLSRNSVPPPSAIPAATLCQAINGRMALAQRRTDLVALIWLGIPPKRISSGCTKWSHG